MRRRRPRANGEDFWPVEGIDYPYPAHVQEALDLVERETLRLKRANCDHHFDSFRIQRNDDGRVMAKVYECAHCGTLRKVGRDWVRTPVYGLPYERRSPYREVPISIRMEDPGRKPGAFEEALSRAMEREFQDLHAVTIRNRQHYEGSMTSINGVTILRNSNGQVISVTRDEDDFY